MVQTNAPHLGTVRVRTERSNVPRCTPHDLNDLLSHSQMAILRRIAMLVVSSELTSSLDYGIYPVVAAPRRWILISLETSGAVLIPRTEAGLRYLSRSCSSLKINICFISLETPDVVTFHDLRLDYGTYPAVAAPGRLIKSSKTSNVVSIPQKEARLWHLFRNDYLWEVNFDFISLETPGVGNIPQLRMDCDICLAVAAPLRLIFLVFLETPDVGDIPQAENGLRYLSRSCCSFEICLSCIPGDPRCGRCSTN
ncbi:hypothetical protein Taro_024716 [Colocasia esculenta]|uniref:Uncharacterized protein n=1 Tax=Colocasia esculenta TaxID=4460 RepID=A0A843VC35_COLES|nr:hypothetical protein [Colocasia esculenta]